MFWGAVPRLFEFARTLREEKSTPAEKLLWSKIRNKQLGGFKFRFQHPVHRFIADFYCHEKRLIIEIDGGYHFEKEQEELDKGREELLEIRGLKVIRFTNEQVISKTEFVLEEILKVLKSI